MIRRDLLIQYVTSVRGQPFTWGELDCTLFPGYCLDVLLQDARSAEHVGQWHDLKSAVKYCKEQGLTLESWLLENGCQPIADNFQQVGDFLLTQTLELGGEPWMNAAVCLGGSAALCTSEGVITVPLSAIEYSKILGVR